MKISINMEIKAILFGVDESVIGNLDIGENYKVERDTMINQKLWEQFDYTVFGLRRIYETAKLNHNLDVAILTKNIKDDYEVELIEGKGYMVGDKHIDNIIYDIEVQEMNYVDEKMRIIRLYCENGFNIKELLINTNIIENGKSIYYHNSKIPFPDKVSSEIKKLSLLSNQEISNINDFIQKTDLRFSSSQFTPELLTSACFLYDQSYYAPVETLKFMVCIIGLESLLVDGNSELSYRLSRNCAMLLSNNSIEYAELYEKVHKLYNVRSEFVHKGFVKKLESNDVVMARGILRETIFKIIEKNVTKKHLLKELDLKGYIT